MSQIEVTKVGSQIVVGKDGAITVPKIGSYIIMSPGAPGEDLSRNVSVFSNIQRKPD